MTLWTGFKPYIELNKQDPVLQKYVADLQRTSPQADIYNQFTEGGYLGAKILVEAMRRVGPDLTRARLKGVLDTMKYDPHLAVEKQFAWTPNWRYVNKTLQSFTIVYKGSYGGWRAGAIQADPRPAAGIN